MTTGPVLIAAGGTGGHVYPALAAARELADRSVPVAWVGTRAGLEARVLPGTGIAVEWLAMTGLRGKGWTGWLGAPWRLAAATWAARRIIRRLAPRAVLGMGGYVAAPVGLAARMAGVPLVIHEQNAVAGLANRLLARWAARILTGFPDAFGERGEWVGNPVRAAVTALPPPETRLAEHRGPLRLLILGGSQGALALNRRVPEAVAGLPEALRPEILHQAGPATVETARAAYREAGVEAQVVEYIEAMDEAYGWADLVVARAGALTVAELSAAGLGAVLVPLPWATDDHQTANARHLADAGAADVLPQDDLEKGALAPLLARLLVDREALSRMAAAARTMARPDAARRVADACMEVSDDRR